MRTVQIKKYGRTQYLQGVTRTVQINPFIYGEYEKYEADSKNGNVVKT